MQYRNDQIDIVVETFTDQLVFEYEETLLINGINKIKYFENRDILRNVYNEIHINLKSMINHCRYRKTTLSEVGW